MVVVSPSLPLLKRASFATRAIAAVAEAPSVKSSFLADVRNNPIVGCPSAKSPVVDQSVGRTVGRIWRLSLSVEARRLKNGLPHTVG